MQTQTIKHQAQNTNKFKSMRINDQKIDARRFFEHYSFPYFEFV